jgi:hypothetical protein
MASITSVRRARLSLADPRSSRRARLCEENRYRGPVVRSCVQVRRSSRVPEPVRSCRALPPVRPARVTWGPGFGAALAVQSRRSIGLPRLDPVMQKLARYPLRATGRTPSPSARLTAFNLYAVGNVLIAILSVMVILRDNLPQKLACLTDGVQSSTVTAIA